MPLPRDKSQTWFKTEIEELADMRSYDVNTEDGRILRRSRQPFYSSQPREAPVALEPPDLAASPEKLHGLQPVEGQSFQQCQPTKTSVALSSKAQPLCITLNKSQPVENRITRAVACFVKVPVTFSGAKSNIQIKIKRIRAPVLDSKLLHFVSLSDSFIMLDVKLLKPLSCM